MKLFISKASIIFLCFLLAKPVFSQIIQGTATIRENCKDGKVSGITGKGGCFYEVKFHEQGDLSLAQAKAKAAEYGWTLATAAELTDAYNNLKFGQFAFGRLADGRMAVPIQSDIRTYKKGLNIGITGGNQGFFYTVKPGTPIVPPPPSGSNTIKLSGDPGNPVAVGKGLDNYFNREFFKRFGMPYEGSQVAQYDTYERKYGNGIGNIMQDKWGDANYGPILERALSAYIVEKFPHRYKASSTHLEAYMKKLIRNKAADCDECKVTRYEFVGFFVPAYLKVLRTESNPVLSQQFSEYVSYHRAKANRRTLQAWQYYSRRTSAQLNDKPYIPGFYLDEGPKLIDRGDIEAIEYDNSMREIIIYSGVPLGRKSVAEFKSSHMGGAPFYFTQEQLLKVSAYTMPVVAQSFPNEPSVKTVLSVPNYLSKNLSEEARALNLAESIGIQAGTSLGIGATTLFGAYTLNSIKVSSKIAAQISGPMLKEVIVKVGGKLVAKMMPVFTKVGMNASALGAKALGPLLSKAIGPVAVGVSVFMVGFMPTGGKAIEIAAFENNLKNNCYIKPFPKKWVASSTITVSGSLSGIVDNMALSDAGKIEAFSYLFKMLVLDNEEYTHLVPQRAASMGEQRFLETNAAELLLQQQYLNISLRSQILASMDERYQIPKVFPYLEWSLSQAQAESKANFHGWELASETEVLDAWEGGLDSYASLRMASGRFAVPVQKDYSNFKKGANIGAEGGNQGFLYTVDKKDYKRIQNYWKKDLYIQSGEGKAAIQGRKSELEVDQWKIIPAANGWIRLQSLKNPELYLNFSGKELEVVKIEPNWASALWKFHPTRNGYGRLQSKWYPDKFIHNQNGKLELGYTKPGWWSQLWKIE